MVIHAMLFNRTRPYMQKAAVPTEPATLGMEHMSMHEQQGEIYTSRTLHRSHASGVKVLHAGPR